MEIIHLEQNTKAQLKNLKLKMQSFFNAKALNDDEITISEVINIFLKN